MRSHATTDAELLAASGTDAATFRLLYDRYASTLHGFFSNRTSDSESALDLTAETFCEAWLSRDRFEDRFDGSIRPWLFGIARFTLYRSVRQGQIEQRARQRLELQFSTETPHVVPDETWLDGLDTEVTNALAEVPERQRRAVLLRVYDDLAYDEIAQRLDCTPTAARIRVSRGLHTLRYQMEETSHE